MTSNKIKKYGNLTKVIKYFHLRGLGKRVAIFRGPCIPKNYKTAPFLFSPFLRKLSREDWESYCLYVNESTAENRLKKKRSRF